MLFEQIPMVTDSSTIPCEFHKRYPGKQYPGCTCFSSFSCRPKTWEEMTSEERAALELQWAPWAKAAEST